MSAVAFWNARKKQKRNPQVQFQLKDKDRLVIKLKYIFGGNPFENKYDKVGVRQYEIPVTDSSMRWIFVTLIVGKCYHFLIRFNVPRYKYSHTI